MGDLLVNYNVTGEPHIGIVAGFTWDERPEYGTNIKSCWENVIVLSIRRGFKMASLGLWGNPESMLGGFTMTPGDYHIRRLLVFDGELSDTPGERDEWEMIDDIFTRLECDLTLPTNMDYRDHWIPNTGEHLKIEEIRIEGVKKEGDIRSLPEEFKDIKILAPLDPNFQLVYAKTGEKANIYTNKGTGIEFYALDESDNENPLKKLATFERKITYDEFLTGENYYTVEYNTGEGYFDATGRTKPGYRLYVNDNNLLCFEKEGGYALITFAVKAIGEVIRPGDDFQLKFGLAELDGIEDTVDEGDFIAVYDKKLLWRAFAYMDETKIMENGLDSGNLDWNNENRWYFADGNEWDVIVDDANGSITVSPGNGGQPPILPWTSYGGRTTFNTVAYTVIGKDSLIDFNKELLLQKRAMDAANTAGFPNTDGATLAPGNQWNNYVNYETTNLSVGPDDGQYQPYRPNYSTVISSDADFQPTYLESNIDEDIFQEWILDDDEYEQLSEDRKEIITNNYVLNEETHKYELNPDILDSDPDDPDRIELRNLLYQIGYTKVMVSYSAGVECAGLTQQALSYEEDNIYIHSKIRHSQTWGITYADSYKWPHEDGYSWLIWEHGVDSDDLLKYVIPGDMIVMSGPGHTAIVSKIEYSEGTRYSEYEDIRAIEAGGSNFYVNMDRDLSRITSHGYGRVRIFRLKTDEE